ncbi:MAG: hypothetical protein EXQ85_09620 [Alphaproteobacteria bacterium]|nr:hypothetical protein [Alphaproteobacteria bacterium]
MDAPLRWRRREELELTRENFQALFENEIPAIRLKAFATAPECRSFLAALEGANMQRYRLAPVEYIGTAQVEYRWGKSKADYFKAAEKAWVDWHYVIDRAWDPQARLMQRLRDLTGKPVTIAEEPGEGRCFSGIIRRANKGVGRHVDFAPMNTPGWHIAKVTAQLGWNLFFEAPEVGGETTTWNRPWNVRAEAGKEPPMSYGLGNDVIEGAEHWTYKAMAGDVVLFNSRNPHEVAPGRDGRNRLQIGSFIGRMPDRSMMFWS